MGRHVAAQTPLDEEIQEVGLSVQTLMHDWKAKPNAKTKQAYDAAQDRLSILVSRRKRLTGRS